MLLKSKILGCLVGAAAGDAMGAATEGRTRNQIENYFNGYVSSFYNPPEDALARGGKAGDVTDDFSLAYITCEEIIKNNGYIDKNVVEQSLINWSKQDKYFKRFVGPTTSVAIARLKGEKLEESKSFIPFNDNSKTTNGLSMKISPVSLFSNGDIDEAIRNTIKIGMVTHDNDKALSAGCAIAAATAEAMNENASLFSTIKAGLYGAAKGEKIGKKIAKNLAGPSVLERIKLAIFIGQNSKSLSEAIDDLSDYIGSGMQSAESIPAVFGIMAASKGLTTDAIWAAVNIGNDTDTVASMVGGILGTLNGIESLPEDYQSIIEENNEYDLNKLSESIITIINQ